MPNWALGYNFDVILRGLEATPMEDVSSMADNQSPELFGQTPWQTVGPFFHYALPWWGGADLTGQSDIGAAPTRLVGHQSRAQP